MENKKELGSDFRISNIGSQNVVIWRGIAFENVIHGIPVLWIINNKGVTPPWGKVTRIEGQGSE